METKKRGRPFGTGNKAGKGRPKLSEEDHRLRALTNTRFQQILNRYLHEPVSNLVNLKKDQSLTALEHAVLSITIASINKGDQIRLQFLLDRLIGKVPEVMQISEIEKQVENMSPDELLKEIEKAKAVLKNAK